MNKLLAGLIWLCLAAAAAEAGEPRSATVLGANEALAAGSRALQMGDYESGVRLTLAGLEREGRRLDRAKALSNLCAGYTGLGQHDEALAACDEALAIHTGNWRIYNNRALALIGLGRVEEARRTLESAEALQPESPKLARTRIWIEQNAPRTVLADVRAASPVTQ